MQIQNLFQPFDIEFVRVDECPIKMHKNTFFELAYIVEGEGIYHIDQNKFNYNADNLFLLMPFEVQFTKVKRTTTFLFIRFNNIYFRAQKPSEQHSNLNGWIQKLEYIFQNNNYQQGCIIRNVPDKPLVRSLVAAIIQEYVNQGTLQQELVQQLVNTLIIVVARNISMHVADKTQVNNSALLDILHYIHLNIYNSERLKAETIAAHFNISLNYIGEYFKKHTGQNLQQYIINYKLSLVEVRLLHSDMRLNEIAYEFGFTDESHLTKTFKKNKGITPTEYRKGSVAVSV
ncbi:AraC family transcriptional regulator [Cytophagaceae bacterium DM2B3-1]|uniref:AraC family transcriptional regulator n=1 Tax=Xanthocytophaga flava TaxID=3048013 RepID=A0ABT7CJE7_9BACT|nr:AraC family transcriptional regulator [Xanthocytophaga flavus]MDJ1493856.1 AraC family transcriptional regulator [Xanthocytophaga flavus]